jgi:phenylalanyl-tRNA synthetase alpha chain
MENLLKQIELLREQLKKDLEIVKELKEVEAIRIKFLGRKTGVISNLIKELSQLSLEQRKKIGPLINQLKEETEKSLQEKEKEIFQQETNKLLEEEKLDIHQPALPPKEFGHFHPISLLQREVEDLFISMGFLVLDGPELESDYYNFTALNIPETHPAREMQDTFYLKGYPQWLMRTQTSAMQVRAMREYGAPLRAIVPGRCFRNEATDARHEHTFYQLEGFAIDKEINFSHLKGVLEITAKHLYGPKTTVRLRPKFFPFVEPGVNGDISCFLCQGKGCQVCKHSGWLEVFGAGLIHPQVLKAGGIDPGHYQGFAFGFGFDRLVMLKYGINDVRLLKSGDLRLIKQF